MSKEEQLEHNINNLLASFLNASLIKHSELNIIILGYLAIYILLDLLFNTHEIFFFILAFVITGLIVSLVNYKNNLHSEIAEALSRLFYVSIGWITLNSFYHSFQNLVPITLYDLFELKIETISQIVSLTIMGYLLLESITMLVYSAFDRKNAQPPIIHKKFEDEQVGHKQFLFVIVIATIIFTYLYTKTHVSSAILFTYFYTLLAAKIFNIDKILK